MYHSFLSASWPTTHLVMWKCIAKVPNQKVTRRASLKIAWLFHSGFCTKQQHFTLSSAPAHRFFTTLKPHRVVIMGHWRTPPYISLAVERYLGWSCVLNCFMYLISLLFAGLLSLHIVTFCLGTGVPRQRWCCTTVHPYVHMSLAYCVQYFSTS